MRSFLLLPFVALFQICQAFKSPDIYALVQPDGASPDLGRASRPPTVPSQSRHSAGPSSGLNIFVPDYRADPNWLPLVLSLKTVGLQVKVIQSLNISSQCRNLLVYASPSVSWSPSSADVTTLTSFVNNGGNLIFMNQVASALQGLAGVSASTVDNTGDRSVLQLIGNSETNLQSLQGFNFNDFYDISMPFHDNYTQTGFVNVGYTPAAGSQTLGRYFVRKNSIDSVDTSATSASIVKNQPSGATGHVYSFGMDLGYLYIQAQGEAYGLSPWYDGHYYPGYDIGNRFIKNIVTSSAAYVSLWTVPYNKGLAFTTTWDIDTYISYPHGQGIAAAAMEKGAAGNLNLHTKYITDTYETAYFQYGIPYIYQITGFRNGPDGKPFIDFGSHSVSHSPNAVDFPYGTLNERFINGGTGGYSPTIYQCGPGPNGTPNNGQTCTQGGTSGLSFWTANGTASGEVRVSAWLIRYILNTAFGTNYNLTTYRPGNLAWNKYQATQCVANGYIGGSSCSGNSHLTHLPFQVTHNREAFDELPYYEFPLQWSDGDGNMSSADFPGSDFSKQIIDIKRMARYGGQYNILIHPSDALLDKIQIQRALHDTVRPFSVFFNQTGFANWWTIRDRASVDITATTNTTATMVVRLDGPVEGLTLQVPKNYAIQNAQAPLTACQQLSSDSLTNAVVLRNTAQGVYTLTFSVGTGNASVSTCPDFTPQPLNECIAWDVAVDDFLELYFYNNGVNLLLLQTISTGLASNNVDGKLQLTANNNTENGVNSYYSEISRFCFDATVYTHLFFDMVAPVGSRFYVQLVSFDSGCHAEVPSPTYLDVTSYAAADGTNHTVTIPLADFAGQDMSHVRAIRIGNISPAQTPIYIDNIKIQRRCFEAPGENLRQGLSIESFQNVDRWITGVNNIFGATDYDNSMTFAKLSELGKMQLLPSNSSSYFYTSTSVNGRNLNAAGYTSLSLNVRGPSGGAFNIVLTSGNGAESTVSSGSYGNIGPSDYANITIPLSAFSGLDTSSISRITLRNFTPNGGSAPDGVFTLRWISLLGGPVPTPRSQRCTRASGYVVLDFCDTNEFRTQTNALSAPFSDDNTMQRYTQPNPGYVELVPRDASSYFYTLFTQPGGCATVNSTYNAVSLSISGPQGSTVNVGFRHGGATCNTNVVTDFIPITLNAPRTEITIPFSAFPTSFNQNNIQSFVLNKFSSPGATYRIYSLTFVGPSNSPGCAQCSGTLLNTCTFTSNLPRTNQLQGQVTDEGSLNSYSVDSDGSLDLGTNPNGYWYSQFGTNACYNANQNNATGLQISVAAPSGTTFNVNLRYSADANCTTLAPPATVPIASYVTFSGNSSYQVAQIPFSDFPGLNASRLNSIALSGFAPSNIVKVGCVSLVNIRTSVRPPTCSCPVSAWLNYCSGGRPDRNSIGGIQSDDGTMRTPPALVNGALQLQPSSDTSYWYSLLNCLNISNSTYMYLNVTANAGATFRIELQSSGNACADSSQIQRASVVSNTYGSMTGSPVQLAIPLSAFTSQNSAFVLTAINAVVLTTFSNSNSAYTLNCAYFGGAPTTPAVAARAFTF